MNNYLGKRGEERYVKLVLKSIADVGLVGLVESISLGWIFRVKVLVYCILYLKRYAIL